MKTLLTFFILLFIIISSNAQINWTAGKVQTELTASEELSFSANVELNVRTFAAVGWVIETVNTSNFEGNFYFDASIDDSGWVTIASREDYTFTHAAGADQETVITLYYDDFYFKYIRGRVETTSDAQSINVTPYYKTIKGYR